ncbi:hypothetical protein P154DRAFT_521991 [Amniculicola lignicola CBS 123094]|uniref:Tr-type G domain-containing protein n=1 Tax=Amniculicola lignicola CBS 123094 TaxID=1392246 RepID=A0A6A5WGQ6_9PLEO|nr:hypothetical protein P154DRAFT_521991 [Amniculicola lignicola CBS 123094]
MASIFTFDPDPPRVSSPWSTPPLDSRPSAAIPQDSRSAFNPSHARANGSHGATALSNTLAVDYSSITRLEAEPQEGPTEYKLHLLLRRRRSFLRASTGRHISGSLRRVETPTPASSSVSQSLSESTLAPNNQAPVSAIQSRQHRLEQLTTQLLWRLQQSSPYHISSSNALVPPAFPDEAALSSPAVPRRLLPGLEESRGALYEIGVADDGTFVGLAEDEMEESLNNLRAMAASLGCRVDVLKMVDIGDCEWAEDSGPVDAPRLVRTGRLFVAEAFVRPDQHHIDRGGPKSGQKDPNEMLQNPNVDVSPLDMTNDNQASTQQLRISLTGATMSGKSSLLGTLSTATLDNGRGKSRLSLLKHRHEIASGMTSSVTQELIGYRDVVDECGARTSTQVISYGTGDVSSWVDIHASAEDGRLVFLSDSAGHPRFRRTTLRGLIGWDPHWTLLCIPADNTEDSSGKIGSSPTFQESLGTVAADIDLSQAHLQLCLNLELPLIVIITKYDLATKAGLRQTLTRILSPLKDAGRKPCIISDPSSPVSEAYLNLVSAHDLAETETVVRTLEQSPLATVPIILTSAVRGTGINKLHAFLRELPLPAEPKAPDESPGILFHIEDIYSNLLAPSNGLPNANPSSDRTAVIGGHLHYGTLHIGDELVIGPYPVDTASDDSDSGSGRGSTPPNHSHRSSPVPTSRSFPGALNKGKSGLRAVSYASDRQAEWRHVRISSIRNLRLPVRTLLAGQVGTIGVAPLDLPIATPALVRIRKGMVLAGGGTPKSNRVVVARFTGENAGAVKSLGVGSGVVVHVASVRASAKVLTVVPETDGLAGRLAGVEAADAAGREEAEAFGFGFDEDEGEGAGSEPLACTTLVSFQFIASKEFVERGAKVLVLPGGGPGLYGGTERGEKGIAGLEGFVGWVVEEEAL